MLRFSHIATSVSLAALAVSSVHAQEAAPAAPAAAAEDSSYGIQEIVVTAQKRAETANKVGMSITAVTGDLLVKQNIVSAAELVKVVPGFTFTEAPRGAPVFAIRGIGFDDSTVGSASTVALYTDEVPISFPMEARFPTLDLERVEVLKGPQGILFGQNSTAGAINFIAAKPTDEFKAGFDGSFGRFNHIQASGFMSGPLTENLKTRLAISAQHSTGWQTNNWVRGQQGVVYADRTNLAAGTVPTTLGRDYQNKLGAKRGFAARWITEWTPADPLKITLNVNGWVDKSDTQAAQLLYAFPLQAQAPFIPYSQYPTPPRNARSADWDPYLNTDRLPASVGKQEKLRRDDSYIQASARIDYTLTDNLTLTSISAYSRYKQDYGMDVDGTALTNFSIGDRAYARTFSQEVRVAGDYDDLKFIVGANYLRSRTAQYNRYYVDESSVYVGFINNTDSGAFFKQPLRDIAAFANVDYTLDLITLHAGIRYTEDKRSYTGCTQDYGDGVQANAFNIVIPLLNAPGAPLPNIQPGGCTSSNVVTSPALVTPTNPTGQYFSPGLANFSLKENNVSWRLGADFQVTPTTMLYANVSKGYKSGSFPAVNVASNLQLEGVKQESVLAYEAGVKAGLFDRRVQLNLAGFYNDYRNKQLRGRILDPFGFFGVLDKLLNIPKSRVYGAEVSLQVAPTQGLNLNFGGTYVNTKITRGNIGAYDPVGNPVDYTGLSFAHTPKWNFTASADYEFPVSETMNVFAGASLLYQSKTMGLLARPSEVSQILLDPTQKPGVTVPGDSFNVKAYTTVDAQLGVSAADNQWKAWIWGKNIFNTYYWNNATQSFDSIYRLTAMPATYGASVSFRF